MKVILPVYIVFFVIVVQGNIRENEMDTTAKPRRLCYVCNSIREPGCADPTIYQSVLMADCAQFTKNNNSKTCRKIVQAIKLDDGRVDYRTVRTCGFLLEHPDKENSLNKDRCYTKAGTSDITVTYCACHSDGCNSSPKLTYGSTLSFAKQTGVQIIVMIVGSYALLKDGNGGL